MLCATRLLSDDPVTSGVTGLVGADDDGRLTTTNTCNFGTFAESSPVAAGIVAEA
jgi:hypothetical protein